MTAVSPLSTGGSGPSFERDVAVHYLAALLTGGPARGVSPGSVLKVALQQRGLGAPLDDVIVETRLAGERARLDLQLKRSLSLSKRDADFRDALKASWQTFHTPEFSGLGNRFGIAAAHIPIKARIHYARVPRWARASGSARDFFRLDVAGLASDEMREFVRVVRESLEEVTAEPESVTDDSVWRFLKAFIILDFDYTQDGSRDRNQDVENLRQVVPNASLQAAERLHTKLGEIAFEAAQVAGSYTDETLRLRLAQEDVKIGPSPNLQADLERIADHTQLVLESIGTTIGGVALDRTDVVSTTLESVSRGERLILTGSPGIGKSAVLRAVAEARRSEGPVIALGADRLAGAEGWDGFASRLGLTRNLSALVANLSGSVRPTLLIDGIDRIEEVGPRLVVNDLLSAIAKVPPNSDGSPRWSTVFTSRVETLETVREWLAQPGATSALGLTVSTVPALTDADVKTLATELPHLAKLLSSERVGPVIRNPYFLHVIQQSLPPTGTHGHESEEQFASAIQAPVSEADVLVLWWERVVGRDANRARQQTVLAFGDQLLKNRTHSVSVVGVDGDVLRSLEKDAIMKRDDSHDSYSFGHDILEEWAGTRALATHQDPIAFLRQLGNPYWAANALQLLGCWRLEENGPDEWYRLLSAATEPQQNVGVTKKGDRGIRGQWVDTILTAPLRSSRLFALLPLIADTLLSNNAAGLINFLRVLRTRFIRPNPTLYTLLDQLKVSGGERDTVLLDLGIPDVSVWVQVLDWLVPQLMTLPGQVRDEASRVMIVWQRLPITRLKHKRAIAEAALDWRKVLTQPAWKPVLVERDAVPFFDRLRDIVVLSADVLPERIPAFLRDLRQTESKHVLQRWIGDSIQPGLAVHATSEYVDFILDVLVPRWRDAEASEPVGKEDRVSFRGHRNEDDEWEHLHIHLNSAFIGASHLRGPFLNLLLTNEQQGLRLINTLVNRATAAYGRNLDLNNYSPILPFTLAPASRHVEAVGDPRTSHAELSGTTETERQEKTYVGDARAYQWFRPNSNAPYPVRAALMALEVWLEGQVEGGRDPIDLFKTVLDASESTAVVAVCVAITLAYPDKCLVAGEPFVKSPVLWQYDISRWVIDQTPTIDTSAFTGIEDPGEKAARSRDNRPQRREELRLIVWRYLFSSDTALAARVATAIEGFGKDLSLLTTDEQADPVQVKAWERQADEFAAWGNVANYRRVQFADGQVGLQFVPPKELVERHAKSEPIRARNAVLMSLHLWADKTLESGVTEPRFTLAEAALQTRELAQAEDFTAPVQIGDTFEIMRLETIAATAAALLKVDPSWTDQNGYLPWCKTVLISAAQLPHGDGSLSAHGGVSILIPASRGLLQLVRIGKADTDVRLALGHVARYPEERVSNTLFGELASVWDVDPILCQNLVQRELALATAPKRYWDAEPSDREDSEQKVRDYLRKIDSAFQVAIQAARLPERLGLLVAVEGEEAGTITSDFWTSHITHALRAVPTRRVLDGTQLGWSSEVVITALNWTISRYNGDGSQRQSVQHDFPYGWPDFLGEWLALLGQSLDPSRAEEALLAPLETTWPATAELTTAFLYGYTAHGLILDAIPPIVHTHWRRIAGWVIPKKAVQPSGRSWSTREREEALAMLLHVRYGRPTLTTFWTKAPEFKDVYERWMEQVGSTPWALRIFLRFLAGPGVHLDPAFVVRLLSGASDRIGASAERDSIWREGDTGREAGQALATLWERAHQSILSDEICLREFVAILDELSRTGVPLAATLRQKV